MAELPSGTTAQREPARSMASPASLQLPADWRRRQRHALAFILLLAVLVAASVVSLDLQWRAFFSTQAVSSMGRFVGEFFPPDLSPGFVARTLRGAGETLAMSALGTLLAAAVGLVLALLASRPLRLDDGRLDTPRGLLPRLARPAALGAMNLLRAIPELVWAALLLIGAGLGPFAGTLALAAHTSGVLGRLFTEAIENAPPEPALALRRHGAGRLQGFAYATWPQLLPQLVSYVLYRWENNIRAATVLGVVGAGGLGQMLVYHLGLFQMDRTATVVGAMLVLVLVVDGLSVLLRRRLVA